MVSMHQVNKFQVVANMKTQEISKSFYMATGVKGGLPKSGIVQIEGSHCIEWFIEFLRASPSATFFWSELHQSALALRRLIQSKKYDVILATHAFTDSRIISTLQIFAMQADVLLILVANGSNDRVSPANLRLQITSAW